MSNTSSLLNKKTLLETGFANGLPSSSYPERVLQIGEGNFLRGFIDWMFFEMNKVGEFQGRVVALQPTPRGKVVPKLNRQDCLYTLIQRGIYQGTTVEKIDVIDSISRGINPYSDWEEALKVAESPDIEFVFSNTTEAGLQYVDESFDEAVSPLSFPGKLVSLLFHRYTIFNGEKGRGWMIIPCELVENNGVVLKELCKKLTLNWGLPESFWTWVENECSFCNTLVDRIVTGFPHGEEQQLEDRLGYQDELMTVAEPYHLFVIDGPTELQEKLPFKKAGLNVYFDDITSYRELKVKLLNAPHTLLASCGILYGVETVREGIKDDLLGNFIIHAMMEEISSTLQPKEKESSSQYIHDIIDRFLNPFLHHRLLDISLNGYSKYRTRVMPSLLAFKEVEGAYPKRLAFSLAALTSFYKVVEEDKEANKFFGHGPNGLYEIRDSHDVISKFREFWEKYDGTTECTTKLVKELVVNDLLGEKTLSEAEGLSIFIAKHIMMLQELGMEKTLEFIEQ